MSTIDRRSSGAFRPGVLKLRTNHVGQQLLHRPVRLLESGLGERDRRGIRVGNGDAPEALPPYDPGRLVVAPVGVVQVVGAAGVAVRPAIALKLGCANWPIPLDLINSLTNL